MKDDRCFGEDIEVEARPWLPAGRQLQHAIQQWNGVQERERWEVSTTVHDPIPGLLVHGDGLLCTRASEGSSAIRPPPSHYRRTWWRMPLPNTVFRGSWC